MASQLMQGGCPVVGFHLRNPNPKAYKPKSAREAGPARGRGRRRRVHGNAKVDQRDGLDVALIVQVNHDIIEPAPAAFVARLQHFCRPQAVTGPQGWPCNMRARQPAAIAGRPHVTSSTTREQVYRGRSCQLAGRT